MNRTVANIDPTKRQPAAITRGGRDRKSAGKDGKEGDRHDGFKALKMHRSLVSLPHAQRTRLKSQMEDFESFDKFNLLPSVKDAVMDGDWDELLAPSSRLVTGKVGRVGTGGIDVLTRCPPPMAVA